MGNKGSKAITGTIIVCLIIGLCAGGVMYWIHAKADRIAGSSTSEAQTALWQWRDYSKTVPAADAQQRLNELLSKYGDNLESLFKGSTLNGYAKLQNKYFAEGDYKKAFELYEKDAEFRNRVGEPSTLMDPPFAIYAAGLAGQEDWLAAKLKEAGNADDPLKSAPDPRRRGGAGGLCRRHRSD